MVASMASGTAPPNMPECRAWVSVRTRRVNRALPRSATVSPGVSLSQLLESATTIRSAARASRLSVRNWPNEREPYSSSPSTKRLTPSPKSAPSTRRTTFSAVRWVSTPALSSAVPRP